MRWAIALLFATLSTNVQEWGSGPARWLMTKDEQRAWSKVQTDAEANAFIDLFWARRDPTEGTERNEFKEEFERRVASADRDFAFAGKRGSLTDPGRVLILLGAPRENTRDGVQTMRKRGAIVFTYDNHTGLSLTQPTVHFAEDATTHEYKLDPQGGAFGALTNAVKEAVIRPDFTAAPEWALHGGVDAKSEPAAVRKVVIVDAPQPAPVAQLPAGPHGASRLVFVKDLTAEIQPRSESDPFAAAKPVSTFAQSEQLGYAFQLCREGAQDAPVQVKFSISGTSGGKKVSVVSRPQEMTPEPIRVMSTCSVVWASLPLSSLKPGSYKLAIEAADPATQENWKLGGDFKVE
jgi:GWxTD domain-containing protein